MSNLLALGLAESTLDGAEEQVDPQVGVARPLLDFDVVDLVKGFDGVGL